MNSIFKERDLSWLSFNHRVLQEANDPSIPLYERLKFLAIYSSNLDEFFRVRVSSMRSFKDMDKKTRKQLNVKPKRILKKIKPIIEEQQKKFGHIFENEILPALKQHHIHLVDETQLSKEQKEFAKDFFEKKIKSHLNLQIIETNDGDIFLENKSLYLIVPLESEQQKIAIINIPSDSVGRFVVLPNKGKEHYIIFLDDILRLNIAKILDQPITKDAYSVKISRDAELYLGDEFKGNLIQRLKESLTNRDKGLPTRFLYEQTMPTTLLNTLKKLFKLKKYDIVPGARYHNFNDFFGFPDPTDNPDLSFPPMPPLSHPMLEQQPSLLAAIKERDYILHFPYQSYDYITKLIWEAADDPDVTHFKITLYRVASKSEVTKALLHAIKKGKKVTAFIELKARFDEASNLYWGEQLQQAGANVIYSYPAIKVHTKLLLIQRNESDELVNYAYIGTGNFNEKTARIYCDHALLTADPRLTEETLQVFELLERKIILPKTKHIFISPFSTRSGFEKLIKKEVKLARQGKKAYMILKMNSLEDLKMIEKLYQASQAGVKIQLIIRGICCLVPQVKGLSDNITVISIVGRFLEHARVYIFGNEGQEKMYLASADWMTRNLDRRVEVVFPIYHPEVYQELREIINIQLADNTKARIINAEQDNIYVKNNHKQVDSQIDIYKYLSSK